MLSWTFYDKELRETIKELKAKNDFRPEGLRPIIHMKLRRVFGAILTSIIVDAVINRNSIPSNFWNNDHTIAIIVLVVLLLASFMFNNSQIFSSGKDLRLLATGSLTDGNLIQTLMRLRNTWFIDYTWVGPDDREREHRMDGIATGSIWPEDISGPDRDPSFSVITILYDPMHPYESMVYLPNFHLKRCISKSQYEKLRNLPCIREKIND